MLYGPDGKIVSNMNWKKFEDYQRWDEFPERKDNPPMTVDFAFWYNNKKYFCKALETEFIRIEEKEHQFEKGLKSLLL